MKRNQTVWLECRGVPLANLLRLLERYPNASIRMERVFLDLGVEEPSTIVAPITPQESKVNSWNLDRAQGIDPEVDALLNAIESHPAVTKLRESVAAKRELNNATSIRQVEEDEKLFQELQDLIDGKGGENG